MASVTPPARSRYDVVVAGARCAGAATAMLLARAGLRVLVVDPARPGSDTLSTHALMRGAVAHLSRWGILGEIAAAGTPAVRSTTFLYASADGSEERVEIPVTPRGGVECLYAPRRTLLDPALQAEARRAGAELRLGWAVTDLLRERDAVVGVEVTAADGRRHAVHARLVVGADGVRSRVARMVGAEPVLRARHASATVYTYVRDPGLDGYVWGYRSGSSVGVIPTNGGEACVFVSMSPARFHAERGSGLERLHAHVLAECAPGLADLVSGAAERSGVRGFAGLPGFVRRGHGPGWALVGDASYFRDPITAHGITDALREAELLTESILSGDPQALAACSESRATRVRPFMELTDRIASHDWTMDGLKALHLELSREMRRLAAPASALAGTGAL